MKINVIKLEEFKIRKFCQHCGNEYDDRAGFYCSFECAVNDVMVPNE